jgi:hypothetical protein
VSFRLSKAARVEVLRLYVGRAEADVLPATRTQAGESKGGGESEPFEEVTVQLRASGKERTFTAQVTNDFVHWNESIELPAGEVSLKIERRAKGCTASMLIYDLALFASSGEMVSVAWKPHQMLVRSSGPFYRQGPDFSMLSALAFAEELQPDLRVIRRFPASEVIPIEGTEYALVRRDGAVTCPGAFHNYNQSYVVLDRRTGLLAFWQNTITASLNQKGTRVRSRSYSVAEDDESEVELELLPKRVSSSRITAPASVKGEQTERAKGWRQLPAEMAPECRVVTAAEGAAYESVTPAAAETKLGRVVQSCPLGGEGRLIVYTDPCWEEVSGVVTWIGETARRLAVADGASSIQLRRGPKGEWLLAIWRQDAGQVFRIDANGVVHAMFTNAVFGTRQVESCRCSA